jgi:hypothetical protein
LVKLNSSALNAYLYLGQYDRFLESLPQTDESVLIVFYRGLGEYNKQNSQQAEMNFDHTFELDQSLLQARIGKAISFGVKHKDSDAIAALRSLESRIRNAERSILRQPTRLLKRIPPWGKIHQHLE